MTDLNSLINSAVDIDDEALLLASEDGDDHVFSESYNVRMQQLLKKSKPRRRLSIGRYILAAIIIALTLASATGAFWSEITAFLQTIYVQYIDFGLKPDQNPALSQAIPDALNAWPEYWYPDYMTEGYSFSTKNEQNHLKNMVFTSGSGESIDFSQAPGELLVGNDVEGNLTPNLSVGNFEAFALERSIEGSVLNTLAWSDNVTSFLLVGPLPLEELVKIAEHIIFIENSIGG